MLDWDQIIAHALALPGTEASTHYGMAAVKANGHALVTQGREAGSFVLHVPLDTKQILMETDPATYWQTPHYDGWPAVLVRYDSGDPERVLAMVSAARDRAAARQRRAAKGPGGRSRKA